MFRLDNDPAVSLIEDAEPFSANFLVPCSLVGLAFTIVRRHISGNNSRVLFGSELLAFYYSFLKNKNS